MAQCSDTSSCFCAGTVYYSTPTACDRQTACTVPALRRAGIAPGQLLEIEGTETEKQLVASGFGVAIVSKAAARDQIALGRLQVVTVQGFSLHRTLSRLDLPGRQPSAAAAAFGKLLDSHAEWSARRP